MMARLVEYAIAALCVLIGLVALIVGVLLMAGYALWVAIFSDGRASDEYQPHKF